MKKHVEFNSTDKSVGILDIAWINNFGAVLISFALQEVTEKLGYNSEIIDYIPRQKISIVKKLK